MDPAFQPEQALLRDFERFAFLRSNSFTRRKNGKENLYPISDSLSTKIAPIQGSGLLISHYSLHNTLTISSQLSPSYSMGFSGLKISGDGIPQFRVRSQQGTAAIHAGFALSPMRRSIRRGVPKRETRRLAV